MMLIYVPKLTNRIGYTLNLIFQSILHIPFEITLDQDYYTSFEGCKLCYAKQKIGDGLYIKPSNLLSQTSIEDQDIQVSTYENLPIFFETYGKDLSLPFDIFAASFYLVSRYEEYLPHLKDIHQRFDYKNSTAYQHNFLHIPLVNKWAELLKNKIEEQYPDFAIPIRRFHFVNTIDVDAAYSFKGKGVFRSIGATFVILNIYNYQITAFFGRRNFIYRIFFIVLVCSRCIVISSSACRQIISQKSNAIIFIIYF